MKALRVILLLVAAGAVILIGIGQLSRGAESNTFRFEREMLRREYVERSGVARGMQGPQGIEEARALLQWWFAGLEALEHRFPHAARTAHAAMTKVPGNAETQAWRAYADERLQALRAGYSPAFGAADQGIRLDILSVRPGEHPETHERMLRIDFVLWGAPRHIDPDPMSQGARPAFRVGVPASFRQLSFRFIAGDGKAYGEMTGTGEPYRMLKDLERFSDELPPGVVLGTWYVEPFPREAERVEIAVSAQIQGTGPGVLTPSFRWELPVVEDWKLRPGEAFHAETREVVREPAK